MTGQAPCSNEQCKTCNPPRARYYVRVYGPHIEGYFGNNETLLIESPDDVQNDERGNLRVLMSPTPFRPGTPTRPSKRAQKAKTVIYPRGEWTKIVIGEIEPR